MKNQTYVRFWIDYPRIRYWRPRWDYPRRGAYQRFVVRSLRFGLPPIPGASSIRRPRRGIFKPF